MSDTTTALAPAGAFSLVPRSFDEALKFAEVMSRSQLVPPDYQGKPENCLIAVQMGLELGLSPLQSLQNISVVNRRPAIWGDAMLAVVQASSVYEAHEEIIEGTGDSMVAVCRVKRRGQQWHEERFSVADAQQAKLWKKEGPWTQYPRRMLALRARGFALRNKFADVLKGLSMREEVQDIEGTVVAVDDVPREPQRLPAEVSAPTPPAATPAAPPVPPTQTAKTEVTRRLKVLDTKMVAQQKEDKFYEVKASDGVFVTRDEALYKQCTTLEGTDHEVAITWRAGKRSDGAAVRILVGLALDEGGPQLPLGGQG